MVPLPRSATGVRLPYSGVASHHSNQAVVGEPFGLTVPLIVALVVVTAVAETDVAVSTLVSVRDRVIQSYEDIMKMPI